MKTILIGLFLFFLVGCQKVEVGQTWYNFYENEDNPYETVNTNYYKVLEISNGFVLYHIHWKNKNKNNSSSLNFFKYRKKILK